MYTLYHLPGACSLATLAMLIKLDQPVRLVHKASVADYSALNPAGTVPVLTGAEGVISAEGGNIMLYLLEQHDPTWARLSSAERHALREDILFANATMHPAYNRLFFLSRNLPQGEAQTQALGAAAERINHLWRAAETKAERQPDYASRALAPADLMQAVYSRWAAAFPVKISIGPRLRGKIETVLAADCFTRALAQEQGLSA